MNKPWNYLIITASNDLQAEAYQVQLDLRQRLGLMPYVKNVLVVPDPDGRRVGSGGSTLFCLLEVLSRELHDCRDKNNSEIWLKVLKGLRILIVHAGGDSQRLPAYGPCGKIFVPVPGESDGVLPYTLFDRQLPTYLELPPPGFGGGQVVVTSGDVLLDFDPAYVSFADDGITGLSCLASPEQGSGHGVFCLDQAGDEKRCDQVSIFLQKPSPQQQKDSGAINPYGQVALDVGVMNFGAQTAVSLLKIFNTQYDKSALSFILDNDMGRTLKKRGLDFYREICCSLGSESTVEHYIRNVKKSGSTWSDPMLGCLFQAFHKIPLYVNVLPRLDLLHFGTSRQIITSGLLKFQRDQGSSATGTILNINSTISNDAGITGNRVWIEGSQIKSSLRFGGENVLVGVDVPEGIDPGPEIPPRTCLDVIKGKDHHDKSCWFVRCYGIDDTFKDPVTDDATFCNIPVIKWLNHVQASESDIWRASPVSEKKTLWNAKVFPAVYDQSDVFDWLWMYKPGKTTPEQHQNS